MDELWHLLANSAGNQTRGPKQLFFSRAYTQIYSNFFIRLSTSVPDLTSQAELRPSLLSPGQLLKCTI